MTWHIQFRSGEGDHIERFPTPEQAIDAACRLMDAGCDVYGIGTGPLTDSVGREGIAKMYAIYTRFTPPEYRNVPVDGDAGMRE